ncbi:NADH dehydrogenase subunit C [Pseudonocardia autotrophica]|uniref:NADH-quinone oxidoreductase subunit C n=2 Tax=Pseudonocardia TaxID=1847 RepID=A0A1Y2NBI0_PSEAH|nr:MULTISPECIES: NADH-quinone oxidoreductase subunit C [Pseudonocardia]OSY44248.1 NADH-quinone oxidoreductase subunit C/D [Pseudonocardia autotrophica]TDN74022.1 NADH dehydrogenase subunit C [Pseudonocardia autotrophica]BBG04779.1 NADH-quinone oxidoreductase subunit C [Pseudonocardia autotrophica]GEC23435.1 NADH-quinone oxidoreductase subunit C [Pseudonocardia saturnea]
MTEPTGTSKDEAAEPKAAGIGDEPTGGPHSSAQESGAELEQQQAAAGGDALAGTRPASAISETRTRAGMFGVRGTGDTSGYGGLRLPGHAPAPAERPFGGWFDEFADELGAALDERAIPRDSIEQVTVDRDELTLYIVPARLNAVARTLRDDPGLRFEFCSGVSGVDYSAPDGEPVDRPLHVVYHLLSMTYRRRVRLEVALDLEQPHVDSVVDVYPTADWHERETWDMFGIVFDGHPALTRILMPDDWDGHPQRKSYPLGGIPVEYKGAEIPPPDERRAYS